ncbi:unnamed protein product [Brassicogethes aeneus]|uniref:Cuticle protein n=1 Tax=Brassicogethes aeneus TaxID=1431903 RepID=A0A9P0FF66_BRAAE|nr:unnamed protein product [Brassicogethes aeneus]
MVSFKFTVLAAILAVVKAGDYTHGPQVFRSYQAPVEKYSSAPAVSYSSISSPVLTKTVQQVQYAHAPVVQQYAAPVQAYSHPAPVAYAQQAPVYAKAVIQEPDTPPHYDYGYSVNDPHTGDNKMQQETRRGDVVQGMYSLIDADGTKRTVQYTADSHNGFNAVVHREPSNAHVKTVAPVIAKVAAPVHYAPAPQYTQVQYNPAPVLKSYAAPAQYAAPVQYAPAPVPVHYNPAPVQYAPAPVPVHYNPAPVQYAPAPIVKSYPAPAQVVETYAQNPAPVLRYTKTPDIQYSQAPVAHGITYANPQH